MQKQEATTEMLCETIIDDFNRILRGHSQKFGEFCECLFFIQLSKLVKVRIKRLVVLKSYLTSHWQQESVLFF